MSKNPEDYYMQGNFIKNAVGEDLELLDLVEMRTDKKFYLLKENSEGYPLFTGQMMESVKKDGVGNIMIHGFIVLKGEEEKYMRLIKRGAMLAIFGAIGETLGFEIRPSGETAK